MRANEALGAQVSAYFERLWSNQGGDFSVEYEVWADDTWWKRMVYPVQEFTGLSSF